MDNVQLQTQLQPKATNYSNKLTCVKNGRCIAHEYLSKLNLTNPLTTPLIKKIKIKTKTLVRILSLSLSLHCKPKKTETQSVFSITQKLNPFLITEHRYIKPQKTRLQCKLIFKSINRTMERAIKVADLFTNEGRK